MSAYANDKIKEYANEMPKELRLAMGALDDDIRLAIFFVILKYGELSFSEIMKELEIPPEQSSKLTYHIKKLQKGAMIENEYLKKEGVDSHSFYDITEFGEGLLNNLMNTITLPAASRFPHGMPTTIHTSIPEEITLKSNSTQQNEHDYFTTATDSQIVPVECEQIRQPKIFMRRVATIEETNIIEVKQ